MQLPADCPNNLPKLCPSPSPSFQTDVSPIIQATCVPMCHQPGGVAFDRLYGTYQNVYKQKQDMLDQVYACNMPPPDGGVTISPNDRLTLLSWFVCGAPNN